MFKAVTVVAFKGAELKDVYDQSAQDKLLQAFGGVSGVGDEAD